MLVYNSIKSVGKQDIKYILNMKKYTREVEIKSVTYIYKWICYEVEDTRTRRIRLIRFEETSSS